MLIKTINNLIVTIILVIIGGVLAVIVKKHKNSRDGSVFKIAWSRLFRLS